ncbi:hypothetical protein [Exiguobacterium artemiae]|uniref:hypothetical protein n=1 Tax=Exiguobacterium artemiae TaxID=340145 RepID=UPI002964C1D3|nr:hypothetical protein [Exiguobacterium sibiricum]MDW2886691.1 hypothetical protein [Exiguobacterium sibiricum]
MQLRANSQNEFGKGLVFYINEADGSEAWCKRHDVRIIYGTKSGTFPAIHQNYPERFASGVGVIVYAGKTHLSPIKMREALLWASALVVLHGLEYAVRKF